MFASGETALSLILTAEKRKGIFDKKLKIIKVLSLTYLSLTFYSAPDGLIYF